ncbi:hypothetical protein TanjilG_15373 [Lupinus angustifolius]|uniref:Uncharacterized protein n=1 Tax=Lupinus angustifolius TaxID=3871 RepID=A0A394DB58_LUPAN|nr:hypothetical protein TanjilG_15373 [Lupinus angustifolius]
MAMSKAMLVLFLNALFVCSLFTHDVEARGIQYGVIKREEVIGCSKKHTTNCRLPIANSYKRGCEAENGCRDKKHWLSPQKRLTN